VTRPLVLIVSRTAILALLATLSGCASWSGSGVPARVHQEPGWLLASGVRAFAQQGTRDCGAAALTSVLDHWQPGVGVEEVRQLTGPPDADGIEAGRLRAVAQRRGLQAFLIAGSLADLDRELGAGRPVLVGLVRTHRRSRVTHYQVIAGRHAGRALLLSADPERGWLVIPLETFLAEWEPAQRLTLIVSR
jgi:ABC-type bacteriocin/lantibiotic exporter with double-glycine peptidase domain